MEPIPVEDKVHIVLSVLAGEVSMAEAARQANVSQSSVSKWKRQFLEAGQLGLAPGRSPRLASPKASR